MYLLRLGKFPVLSSRFSLCFEGFCRPVFRHHHKLVVEDVYRIIACIYICPSRQPVFEEEALTYSFQWRYNGQCSRMTIYMGTMF